MWVSVIESVMSNVRGFVFLCVLHNQSIPFYMTFHRDSSIALDEIHCSVGSQNAGRCVDMPTLCCFRFTLVSRFDYEGLTSSLFLCTIFLLNSICILTKVCCHGHFAPY